MKILFDQGTPAPLRHILPGHDVHTAFECGWQTLSNGELLAAAEEAGFELIITTDQNLRQQQILAGRPFAVLVLSTTNWGRIRRHGDRVVEAIRVATHGVCTDVSIP